MNPVSTTSSETLAVVPLAEAGNRPLLLEVESQGGRLLEWAQAHREAIDAHLLRHGALLVRGLRVTGSKQFGQLLSELFGDQLLKYDYRSTPRTELRDNVYTATEYHPAETIPQHNESSYANQWAMRAGFFCLLPAASGGATPLADSRAVYRRIPEAVRDEFERRQVRYVRNYGDVDLPWSEVFQTDDRAAVERYCDENHIRWQWKGERGLRTEQINPAVAEHPTTGERVWFNQAHLFHVSSLGPAVRDSLLAAWGVDDLPRNAYYGDGAPIPDDALQAIREAYDAETFHFAWRRNDLLLLDNMLITHGRQPFTGDRKVLVGMARAHGHVR